MHHVAPATSSLPASPLQLPALSPSTSPTDCNDAPAPTPVRKTTAGLALTPLPRSPYPAPPHVHDPARPHWPALGSSDAQTTAAASIPSPHRWLALSPGCSRSNRLP